MENATTKTATVTAAVKPSVEPTKVGTVSADNGKSYDLFKIPITKGVGGQQGNSYFGPDFTNLGFADVVALHGEETAKEMLIREYKRLCNATTKAAIERAEDEGLDADPNAIFNLFKESFKELAVQGLTKSELEDEKEELMGQLMAIAKTPAPDMVKFKDITGKLEKVNKSIENKSRERKPKTTAPATAPVATPA